MDLSCWGMFPLYQLSWGYRLFFLSWVMLSFAKCFYCVSCDDHVIFILCLLMGCVTLLVCEYYTSLHLWNKRFLSLSVSMYQFSSVTQTCPTLCNPMDCSMLGFPFYHQLLKLAETHVRRTGDAIQPSHPLSSPSPPAFNLSQHQGLFQWISYKDHK